MGRPLRDLKGQKFGRWTALHLTQKPNGTRQSGAFWVFQCDCGTIKTKRGADVVNKGGSCGCLKKEVSSASMKGMQLQKHGTIEERFLSRFKKDGDNCWNWTAHSDKDGYGILPTNKGPIRAHRFSFEYHTGKITEGNVVCHSCDNPSCVNPNHLFQGTVKDNCNDMMNKNRDKMIGSRNNKAKLKESDIPKIKSMNCHNSAIAEFFGVSESTIKRIKNNSLWRHVK